MPGSLLPMSFAMAPVVACSLAWAMACGVILVSSVTNVSSARYCPRHTYTRCCFAHRAGRASPRDGLTVALAGSPSATTRSVNIA